MANFRASIPCFAVLVLAASAGASPLSDSELYFDPASLADGFYPDRDVDPGMSTSWLSAPGRVIAGANILPVLRNNLYDENYAYSQSDYESLPNVGYAADLTAGVLTATFQDEGIYHVRVNYTDGTSDIHAVFVDVGIAGKQGQDAPNKTGKTKVTPTKAGDVVYISEGNADDGAMNNAKELFAGLTIVRVSSVSEIADDLAVRSGEAGRKLDAVIVGHGYSGSIRLGKEGDPAAERINNNGDATSTSGADFGGYIRDYASSVNLAGCNTGAGAAGARLLNDIYGAGVSATAYTSTVYYGKTKMYLDATGTKIPAPGGAAVLVMVGLGGARRRRVAM